MRCAQQIFLTIPQLNHLCTKLNILEGSGFKDSYLIQSSDFSELLSTFQTQVESFSVFLDRPFKILCITLRS